VELARALLTALFNDAVASHKIAENPAVGIRLPRGRAKRAEFYMASREELEKLAAGMGDFGLSVWLMRVSVAHARVWAAHRCPL